MVIRAYTLAFALTQEPEGESVAAKLMKHTRVGAEPHANRQAAWFWEGM